MEHERNNSDDNNDNPWLRENLFANIERPATDSHEAVRESVELPNTSPDYVCRAILRFIERDGRKPDVENFINERLSLQPKTYTSTDGFLEDNPGYEAELESALRPDEKAALKEYSGYRFAWINNAARGFWDYDKMGAKTPEAESEVMASIEKIRSAIPKSPASETDFVTFRGTNLDGFRAYGVHELSDLANMKGQCMLEQGFTSTALLREKSFADGETESLWINKSNVEVRYHIPSGSHDQLALFTDGLSYSPDQTEVLINRNSLFYISNVEYPDTEHAVVDALLIPRDIYDKPGARDRT